MNKVPWILRILMVISFLFLLTIIIFTSPYADGNSEKKEYLNILFFAVSFFVFFSGFFSLVFYRIRKKRQEKKDGGEINHRKNKKILKISLRQGIILSFSFLAITALQSFRVLTWWVALLVAGALFFAELYFLSEKE